MARSSESDTMSQLAVEKERLNESKYRKLYTDLLQKHKGLLTTSQDATGENQNDYAEESKLVQNAMTAERDAMLYGLAGGIAAFVSLRFFPKYMIWRIGGKEKLNALKEAEAKAKEHNGGLIGKATAFTIESLFSIWIGTKVYQETSRVSEGTYELISQIPLCKGRSTLAENLCEEWVNVGYRKIPPAFWKNVGAEERRLQDERAWKAIRTFSANCIKRKKYEAAIRKERGIPDQTEPVVLPNKVPEDILSDDQAQKLVTDRT